VAGVTVRVSESSAGEEGDARSIGTAISGDGLVTAFGSEASNLVPDDTNFVKDIFVHDDRPAADLSVEKTDAPDPVTRGSTLTYTLLVNNLGPGTASSVQLSDTLPESVRFVDVSTSAGSCSQADGIVTCALGDLASGASVTVTIHVTARRTGTATNTAQVGSLAPDPNPANNTATTDTLITR